MKLSNISIRKKLLFVILLPLIALAALAGMKIMELQQEALSQTNVVKLMNISVAAGNLVHEMQKERGTSAGFVSSGGKSFADVVPKQRLTTDEKYQALTDILSQTDTSGFGEEYNKTLQSALSDFAQVKDMREKVSGLQIPAADVVSYYTDMNTKFLGITKEAIFVADQPSIIRDASAYLYYLRSKELSGIERAVGTTGFSGGWNRTLIDKFLGLIKIQETFTGVFLSYANPQEKIFFEEKNAHQVFKEVEAFRSDAFKMANATGPVQAVDATAWFKTVTDKINIQKEIEDHIAQDIIHTAGQGAAAALAERNMYLFILVLLIGIVCVLTFLIVRDMLGNITNTQGVMAQLAKGNAEVDVVGINRKDEIGGMARSIASFKESLIQKQQLEFEALKAQSRAEEQKRKVMEDLASDFDSQVGGLINSLASASTELQSTAQNMRNIADETSQSSQTVAASSEEASTNVSAVAAAMDEMTASSSEISSQINGTRVRSNDTAANAKTANETVSHLNKLVSNIGEVVNAIRDIADQTNLLALNATIEAARAGDAGKGFAVVAEEVKKLASETAAKTNEIEGRIAEIQKGTNLSVDAVQKVIANISEIDQAITAISSASEEQNATNSEINRSVSEASMGVQNVTEIISMVQRGADETGSSADAVLTAANELAKLSEGLKASVGIFLNKIRNGDSSQNTGDSIKIAA